MKFQNPGSIDDILYWSKRLYQKGMSPSTSGNVSVKKGDNILITASGTCLNDLDANDVVEIDYNGNVVNGSKKPSSEKIMHSSIYTERDDISAIIHCHCPLITAFCAAGKKMDKPILPDFVLVFGEIPIIPFFCPSGVELADAVALGFKDNDALLLQNHGVVIGADTLQNAFYKAELIRTYAEIYFGAEVLGGSIALSKKHVKEIKNLYTKANN